MDPFNATPINMKETLESVFRAVFDLPEGSEIQKIQQLGFASWDSLAHVTLISAIESEFSVSIDLADSIELTSFEAILLYLEEHQ
jgi:acyl carrier protein